jgi:hypothetical protein
MKRFSLLTLLLLTAIAGLIFSQVVMMRKLAVANAEVDNARRKYGYISVGDPTRTYVSAIAENEQNASAIRIIVPAGSRYLLHLSDTTFNHQTKTESLPPTKTISLNSWRDGADVTLTYAIYMENGKPRVEVHTETKTLFNYTLENWVASGQPTEGTGTGFDGQRDFSIDDPIPIMTWLDPGTERGVAIWLEPYSRWMARSEAKDNE